MLTALKRLFKHSFIYAVGTGIQSLAGLFLIPLYTKNLEASAYGQLELLNTLLLVLANLLSLGFASAYLKCSELDIDKEKERKTLAATALFIPLFFSTIVTLLLLFLAPTLTSFFKLDSEIYVYLVFATNIALIGTAMGLSYLRATEKSIKYTVINLSKFFLLIGLNTYFILVLDWGLLGILTGNMISQTVVLILLIPTIIKTINFSFSSKLAKKLLAFGLAIIPAGLAMWVMDLADRYLINYYLGPTEVGYYALAYKFGYVIAITLVAPFQLAWPTVSFSLAKDGEAKKIYSKVLTYFLLLSSFIALLLTIFSRELIPIISKPEYLAGANVVPWVAFSYILLGVHFIIVVGLHIKDKSKYYPLLIIFPGLLNLILNFVLIPRYGIIGAAITTFVSFTLLVILTVIVVDKFYKFKYEIVRILKIVLALALTLIPFFFLRDKFENYQIWFDLTLVLVYILVLVLSSFFSKKEIYYLKHLPKLFENRR